jgi:hypothetical protein
MQYELFQILQGEIVRGLMIDWGILEFGFLQHWFFRRRMAHGVNLAEMHNIFLQVVEDAMNSIDSELILLFRVRPHGKILYKNHKNIA